MTFLHGEKLARRCGRAANPRGKLPTTRTRECEGEGEDGGEDVGAMRDAIKRS